MSDNKSISKLVGFRLKQLRNESGFTAFQLTKEAGLKSEQQLYRYEKGVNRIGIDELVAVLNVLNARIGDFFVQLENEMAVSEAEFCYRESPEAATDFGVLALL
ncbi:DNA-binding helix-turn-helix protein [Providencia rettgeri DSM 1131]|uniref:helix-turn-helix domain-containing protein n=1 Tax=Providencia rettgeri TaxID=587 RepID=UPI000197C00C|nr:helix-turn-helix transcriptional regulator [Providencia rettgeri]EFE54105.1 DNA-binding helix-turn-helix protein [Providencia rettgeri DSM 1131]QXA57399.1 helix-turn-helix domain-containing protein [Providencia rettgeri]